LNSILILPRTLSRLQIDKLVLTTIVTSLLPVLVHALPAPHAVNLGQVWLPIFYAPLVAALIFQPQVSLLAGLLAPTINHFLFNAPDLAMSRFLTLELVVFSAVLLILRRRKSFAVGDPIVAYLAAQAMAVIFLGIFPGRILASEFTAEMTRSLAPSLPGLIMLAVIGFLISRWAQRRDA